MTAALRLLRIESRRSAALWALPVMVAIAWIDARETLLGQQILIWEDAGILLRSVLALDGPVIGGVAAWMAGRDQRYGMEDMLATMPRPWEARLLAAWGGVMAWGVGAYAVIAVSFIGVAYANTSWGSPYLWPIAVGLAALFAHTSVGFAVGWHFPGRFTAPLTAMGLLGVEILPLVLPESFLKGQLEAVDLPAAAFRYLSPLADVDRSVFFGMHPDLGLPHSLLFSGIGGLALVSMAVRTRRSAASLGALSMAAALVIAGIPMSLLASRDIISEVRTGPAGPEVEIHQEMVPYEPVCSDDPLQVCVHPAYEQALERVSSAMNRLAAPLVGIPGAPARAEQVPFEFIEGGVPMRDIPEDVLAFEVGPWVLSRLDQPDYFEHAMLGYALGMVQSDYSNLVQSPNTSEQTARLVIANWLLIEAGVPLDQSPDTGSIMPPQPHERLEAAQRFADLGPAVRDAWLRENFAALRAGEVGVDDLPVPVETPDKPRVVVIE